MFQNRGDNTFDEVGNVLGLALRLDSRGVAAGDIDGDGDQDLVVYNRNAPLVRIYRNDVRVQGRSVLLDLKATKGNPFAVGAQAILTCDDRSALRHVSAGAGFLSQSPYTLHFGVGACSSVDSVVVRWPDGTEDTWRDLPVGQRIALVQGESTPRTTALRQLNASASTTGQPASQGVSAPVPDIAVPGFHGATDTTLPALAEGTAVLNLWATWCVACIAEMPDLQSLATDYGPRGVRFVGIVMDERDKESAAVAFLTKHAVSYPQAWGGAALQAPFASLASVPNGAIPMTVVLHRGLVRHVVPGAIDRVSLAAQLDALLDEDTP